MKSNLKFVLGMALVTLVNMGCKKEAIVEPVITQNTAATMYLVGNAGWKNQKPTTNQQGKTNRNQNVNKPSGPKGGKLASDEVYDVINRGILDGKVFQQQNGQRVYLEKLDSGKYNGVILDKNGQFVDTMKSWSSREMVEKSRTDHWPAHIQRDLNNEDYY